MRLASRKARFTSYDVLQELAKLSNVKTHDLRAIGSIMQEARDLGLITSLDLVRRNVNDHLKTYFFEHLPDYQRQDIIICAARRTSSIEFSGVVSNLWADRRTIRMPWKKKSPSSSAREPSSVPSLSSGPR